MEHMRSQVVRTGKLRRHVHRAVRRVICRVTHVVREYYVWIRDIKNL